MDNFLGMLKLVAFSGAPQGWAQCNGQLLQISQYPNLFQLIGTTYGGDGVHTFAVPDLRGRVPVHAGTAPYTGQQVNLGESGGSARVTLQVQNLPPHLHQVNASSTVSSHTAATGNVFAASSSAVYGTTPNTTMASDVVGPGPGTSQPVDVRQPSMALNYIIALTGIYPSPG